MQTFSGIQLDSHRQSIHMIAPRRTYQVEANGDRLRSSVPLVSTMTSVANYIKAAAHTSSARPAAVAPAEAHRASQATSRVHLATMRHRAR